MRQTGTKWMAGREDERSWRAKKAGFQWHYDRKSGRRNSDNAPGPAKGRRIAGTPKSLRDKGQLQRLQGVGRHSSREPLT